MEKYSDYMGQDLQLVKFWARRRCQIIGKTFMALRFTEAPTRWQRDEGFCVLSRPMICHSPLIPSERKEGKGNFMLRCCRGVHKGQGSSRLSIDALQSVWMTYKLHADSVSQLGIWLLGLLDDPESTIGKTKANVTASDPYPSASPTACSCSRNSRHSSGWRPCSFLGGILPGTMNMHGTCQIIMNYLIT